MTARYKGILVLVIQLLLVLTIAAKYAWERHTCPMVWARSAQFDPDLALRGRYLSLTLHADACGLPLDKDQAGFTEPFSDGKALRIVHAWNVYPTTNHGVLTGKLADKNSPQPTARLSYSSDHPCQDATFEEQADFFISEHAKSPFPLQKGQELWVLVTIPPSGPPRPVELAISDSYGFHPLDLH